MVYNPFDPKKYRPFENKKRNKNAKVCKKKNVQKNTTKKPLLEIKPKRPRKTNYTREYESEKEPEVKQQSPQLDVALKNIKNSFKTIKFENRLVVDAVLTSKLPTPQLDELLPKIPFLINFVAPRNSGKTNNLIKFLTTPGFCYKVFDYILIWSPTFFIDKTWEVFRACYDEEDEYTHFDFYNPDEVENIIETIKENKIKQPLRHYLLIFDDMGDQNICKPNTIGPIEAIAVKGRHYNISAIYVGQKRTMFSRTIRENTTNFVVYGLNNSTEIDCLADELRGPNITLKEFLGIYNYCTHEKYNFMHVDNYCEDTDLKFRKNWNEIIDISQRCNND